MRTLLYSVIVGILCLTNTPIQSEQPSRAVQMQAHYDKWWFAHPDEKVRCGNELRSVVAQRDIAAASAEARAIDAHMRRVGCLDDHSHLYNDESPKTGLYSARLDKPAVEKIGSYLFVYINLFTNVDTTVIDLVKKQVSDLADVETVVIDVRTNPGGSIDELHEILNTLFAPKAGIRYLNTMGQMTFKENPNFFTTDTQGLLAGRKIRILADESTASAAEWMIETLCYEWYPDSCLSIGSQTFGKAILQCGATIGPFSIKLTCGEWFLEPKRTVAKSQERHQQKVQGIGITPDKPMTFDCDRFAYACIAQRLADAGL